MSRFDERRNTPTVNQKAALRGTRGAPSAQNAYVTSADARNSDARTPVAHASSHEVYGDDPIGFHKLLSSAPAAEGSPASSPPVNGWWMADDGGSPRTVSLHVRIDGVDTTLETWTV